MCPAAGGAVEGRGVAVFGCAGVGTCVGGRGTGLAEGVVGSLGFTDGFADDGRGTLCSAAAPDGGIAGRFGAEFGGVFDLFAGAGGRFGLFADDGVGGVPGFAAFAGAPAAGFAAGG